MEKYNEHELFGFKRGEIRRVQVGDSPSMSDRLALILQLHQDDHKGDHRGDGIQWANVMYLHDHLNMATTVDLVISPSSPSYTSAMDDMQAWFQVVQTDLYSACHIDQIKELVATVGDHELECVNQVFRNESVDSQYHWKGTPMGVTLEEAKADPRWAFKVKQGDWTRSAQSSTLSEVLD